MNITAIPFGRGRKEKKVMSPEQRVRIATNAISKYIKRARERGFALPSTEAFSEAVQQAIMEEEEEEKS